MYRITPIDAVLPSPYELLFNRKPRTFLPSSGSSYQSRHPKREQHLEQNERRQEEQARYYNVKAGRDKGPLPDGTPVDVYNTINKMWEPGEVIAQDNPEKPRSYVVQKEGRQYRRTNS